MIKLSNVFKKVAVVSASLALVVPLANATSVSANNHVSSHARHIRLVKPVHVHHEFMKTDKTLIHINKKSNAKHWSKYDKKVYRMLVNGKRSAMFKRGFLNSLQGKPNKKLARNKQYKKGYITVVALDNYTCPTNKKVHLTKRALHSANIFYNDTILK